MKGSEFSLNGRKDRDEDLLLFKELHKREKDRLVSLLQPVSDEFEPSSGTLIHMNTRTHALYYVCCQRCPFDPCNREGTLLFFFFLMKNRSSVEVPETLARRSFKTRGGSCRKTITLYTL